MKSLNELLELVDSYITIVGVCGVHTLGEVVVLGIVAPVVLTLGNTLVDGVDVVDGQQVQVGDAQVLHVVKTRGDTAGRLGAGFNEAQVLANILDAGAGIGGGTGCSGGSETSDASGGNATIKISGNPVILTGSIGGGRTGAEKGNIGTATINIHGGDIQAQFVMAGSVLEGSAFTPPSFNMTAGLIRTSKYNDSQYFHIKEKILKDYLEKWIIYL